MPKPVGIADTAAYTMPQQIGTQEDALNTLRPGSTPLQLSTHAVGTLDSNAAVTICETNYRMPAAAG